MPVDKELIGKKLVVVELVAESGGEFLQLGVEVDEVLASRLEQMLATVVFVLRDELFENGLEGVPMFHDVAMLTEDTLHGNENLVLSGHIELELELAHLSHDIVCGAGTLVCHLFVHECFQLLACLNYYNLNQRN